MGRLPEVGDVVLGKYRVIRALGQGGMGVVFEAVNVATEGRVALKMLKPSLDLEERALRMAREARATARLRSRFVARVYDFDRTNDGAPVIVMELLDGHDLSAEIRRSPRVPVQEAISYVVQACAGIGEAHVHGIIHRDIKPANLFLDLSGGAASPTVRVLDFGLSKAPSFDEHGRDLTATSEALGTLAYMSPEQMRETKNVDVRTDVWALGVVLYRLLVNSLPLPEKSFALATRLFDREPLPRVQREGVPPELVDVVARALEKDRDRRHADARAFGIALLPFLDAPSPSTRLAKGELGMVIAPRPSLIVEPSVLVEAEPLASMSTMEPSTTRTVVSDSEPRTSRLPAPPRSRKRQDTVAATRREVPLEVWPVFAAAALLFAATIYFLSRGSSSTARPRTIAAPPPVITYVPPVLTVPEAPALPAPAPSASVAPPRVRPKTENPKLL